MCNDGVPDHQLQGHDFMSLDSGDQCMLSKYSGLQVHGQQGSVAAQDGQPAVRPRRAAATNKGSRYGHTSNAYIQLLSLQLYDSRHANIR